jgi:hypothetical protein
MKETCSCGAKIELDGDSAMEALEPWRKRHQRCLDARAVRTLWDGPPVSPAPAPIWVVPPVAPQYPYWWQNPVVYSSDTAGIHTDLPERTGQAR